MPLYWMRSSRSESPETMISAFAYGGSEDMIVGRVAGNYGSNVGSGRYPGKPKVARNNASGVTRRIESRRANLDRAITFSSSATSNDVVNSVTSPAVAAATNRAGAPLQSRPETTTLVSATNRTPTLFSAICVDFRLNLLMRHRRLRIVFTPF